jgi:hypothetical protein
MCDVYRHRPLFICLYARKRVFSYLCLFLFAADILYVYLQFPEKVGILACFYLFIFGTKFGIFACILSICLYIEDMKDQDRAFFENVVFTCITLLCAVISIIGLYNLIILIFY